MALSDMVVFNDFMYRSYTETVDQQVRLFNAASNNTLVLQSAANVGDFNQEASFELIAGLVRRRNAYGTGTVSPVDLSQLQKNTVKVAGGTVPVTWEPSQFSWIQRNQEEAGTVIGVQLAEGVIQDYLNSAVSALVGAIGNAGLVYDGTASDLTLSSLVKGSALFGDRSSQLRAWIIHSKPMHDLWGTAVTNGQTLFEFGTVNIVQDGFGRRFIITDSPALANTGASPDEYSTIGLVEGGAMVEDNGDLFSNTETVNGKENIERNWQAEYTFNLGLKGYSWNTSTGGKSPSDVAIGTGTNWPKLATSNKDTAGVIVESL